MVKSKPVISLVFVPIVLLLFIRAMEFAFTSAISGNNTFTFLLLTDTLTGIKLSLIFIAAISSINLGLHQGLNRWIPEKFDGRWLIFLGLIVYAGIVGFSQIQFGDYKYLLRYLGVPAHIRNNFNDLRVITSALDCVGSGKDPLADGNCDPRLIYNYPRIWYILHSIGLGQRQTIPLAIGIIIGFLASLYFLIKKVNFWSGLLWLSVIVSPPVMLAVERCNNDLIIFILLTIALILINKNSIRNFVGYGFIFLGAILKLYPVFSLIVILRETKPKRYLTGSVLFIFILIYTIFNLSELALVNQRSPRPAGVFAFGAFTWTANFAEKFPLLKISETLAIYGVYALLAGILAFSIMNTSRIQKVYHGTVNLDAFRIGAGVYVGCFILGNNYDYRLIFLLFCIPQLLEWLKEEGKERLITIGSLISIVLFMQFNLGVKEMFPSAQEFHAKAILSWFVFGYLVFQLIKTLPKPIIQFR